MNSAFSIWLLAIRPKTLPLAAAAIFLGSAIAAYDGFFDTIIFSLALITALLLQIVSNLANDFGDAVSGADNDERIGPKRVMQAGLVTKETMIKALAIAISTTIATGIGLIYIAFSDSFVLIIGFIALGLAAIYAAITYTMGKSPYGYKGLGDISIFIFFGLVGVLGTNSLYRGDFDWRNLLAASACGLLCASVLNVNNLRDLKTDKQAGKHTLAVKLGYQHAIYYHYGLFIISELLMAAFIITKQLPVLAWSHILTWPLFYLISQRIKHYDNGPLMNEQLKNTVLTTFAYCTLVALSLLFK